jgi:hypothetical protein
VSNPSDGSVNLCRAVRFTVGRQYLDFNFLRVRFVV